MMTQEQMKAEVKRLKTKLIIISKNAAYGMPGSNLRKKRAEAEVAFVTLRNKYQRLYGAFND